MKQIKFIFLSIIIIFLFGTLTGCKNKTEIVISDDKKDNILDDFNDDKDSLVVYFTWSNNTENMAKYIQSKTNSDIYKIIPKNPYPTTSYMEWGNLAKDERDNDSRPEIDNLLPAEEISKYDSILIGFPIWWHTAPMIIGTFLEAYDLTNVNIYPFFQGASNNNLEYYNNSMEFVKRCANSSNVFDGLYTSSTNYNEIDKYLNKNNLWR